MPQQLAWREPANSFTAVASRNGVLFAGNDEQVENLANIKAILFDKTGTLTTGVLHVHETEIEFPWDTTPARAAILWAAIGEIERHSKHPVALLLVEESKRRLARIDESSDVEKLTVEVLNVRLYEGLGICATVRTPIGDRAIAIGSAKFMDSIIPDGSPFIGSRILHESARSVVYVSVDGEAAMSVSYSEAIRSDALSTVQALQAQGIYVALITGDTEASARRVASTLGISPEWCFASCLPTDKVLVLEHIRQRFGHVAMVGDSFNDIPALASSSFSISVSNCSDESSAIDADAHLPRAASASFDLLRIPYLITLARVTLSKIRTNVLWAIIYNILALTLSSGCLQFLHRQLVFTP
jgi:cation transport ATPase